MIKRTFRRVLASAMLMTFLGTSIPSGLVQALAATEDTNGVVVGNVRVQTLSSTLARIELKGPNGFEDRVTYNIAKRDWNMIEYEVIEGSKEVQVKTEAYTVIVPKNATSLEGTQILEPNGRVIWEYDGLPSTREYLPEPGDTPDAWAIADTPRIVPAEWGYEPMPEDNEEFTDYNGWDTTNDSPDMYIFVARGNYRQLLQDFISLTGPSEMIPLKAFGLWYSQYYNYSQSEALADIARFAEEGYPLDVFGVDTDWRVGGRTGYELNTSQWPDLEGFFETAHDDLNLMVFFNDHAQPLTGSMFNDDTAENGDHALNPDEVEYRNENLKKYMEMGLDFWWYDRNWPHSIISPFESAGISRDNFGMYVYQSIMQSQNPDLRPLIMGNADGVDSGVFSRASNLTSHRYSIQWTGDTLQTSASLKQEIQSVVRTGVLNATPYLCSDAGGHAGQLSDNGYIRWSQYASLSPVFRYHSAGGVADRAPWEYGEKAQDGALEYVNMRYRMLPIFYALAHENYETGLPINRRLDINYPGYVESQDDTQYLLGDNILVAPIWDYSSSGSDSRSVFIPDGRWINVFTGESYEGPQTIKVTCDTDTMPIFIRSGSILPSVEEVSYIGEKDWSRVALDVYPSTQLSGSFTLYEDDQSSVDYKEGMYRTTLLETGFENGEVTVNIGAANGSYDGSDAFDSREWTVRIHAPENWGDIQSITLDGQSVTAAKIEKVTGSIPFGGAGAASGDSDIYEITFTKSLSSESKLRVRFTAPKDEKLPEYNSVSVNMDEEIGAMFSNTDVSILGTDDWVVFGANGVADEKSNGGTFKNVTKNGSTNTYNGIYSFTWGNGNTTNTGLSAGSGEVSFDVAVDNNVKQITLFVGGEKAAGRLEITDGSNKHAKIVELENLNGSFNKKVVLTVSADAATTLNVKLIRTQGNGSVAIYAATASEKTKVTGTEVELLSFISDAPASVNFSAESIKDWVHLGYGSNASAVTRKEGVNLLSDPVISGAAATIADYASKINFNDGTPNAAAKNNGNAVKFENCIEFSVPVTTGWQELKIYTGLNYATNTVEIYDEAGSPVKTYIFSNSGTATKCITVQFKAEQESVLHVKTTRTYGRSGACHLAGYTLSDLSEAEMMTSELKSYIQSVEAKNPTVTLKKYTEDSVAVYREALTAAKITSRMDPVEQNAIDEAWDDLEKAVSGLTDNPALSNNENLLTDATATASSQSSSSNSPELSIDGDRNNTRWAASGSGSTDWIAYDLGRAKTFDSISVYWESVSKNFRIQISNDNSSWTTVATDDKQTASAGTRLETTTYFETVTARYVRIYSTKRSNDSFGGAYLSILEAGLYNTGITIEESSLDKLADLVDNAVTNLSEYSDATASAYREAMNTAKALFAAGITDEQQIEAAYEALNTAKNRLAIKDKNYASGVSVTTSITHASTRTAENMVDGDGSTRWESSNGSTNQTITLDLGQARNIYRVMLYWESASNDYTIAVSQDGEKWDTVVTHTQSVSAGTVLTTEHEFEEQSARYVQLTSKKGAPGLGTYLSLYEFEVYGLAESNEDELIPDIPDGENLALGKTATASSVRGDNRTADLMLDGISSLDSRWERSEETKTQAQWVIVDLADVYEVNTVLIKWENLPSTYSITGSETGEDGTWVKLAEEKAPSGQTFVTDENNERYYTIDTFGDTSLRYIRVDMSPETAKYYLSIMEFEVYGPDEDTPVAPSYTKGDTNNDGNINSTDCMQVRRYYLGLYEMTDTQKLAADVNGDNKINSTDFMRISRHFLGLFDIFA